MAEEEETCWFRLSCESHYGDETRTFSVRMNGESLDIVGLGWALRDALQAGSHVRFLEVLAMAITAEFHEKEPTDGNHWAIGEAEEQFVRSGLAVTEYWDQKKAQRKEKDIGGQA